MGDKKSMTDILEPEHYIRILVSRELSGKEVMQLEDIVSLHLEDMIVGEQVLYHLNAYEDMHCYVFEIEEDLTVVNFGVTLGDRISQDLDEWLPVDDLWEMETSLPDMVIPIDETMTEQQIFERATKTAKTLLH